ncbi:MAG TPA: putative sulfate exporter family transporter [Anaeromyxobacteraceae bacterium]|nr:putative sulfate exporter family transporter [Anaeromyxobacteraceae bacterium]
MTSATQVAPPWHRREDTWAIFIALTLVVLVTAAFLTGSARFATSTALTIPVWSSDLAKVGAALRKSPLAAVSLFGVFLAVFTVAAAVMRWDTVKYAAGFAVLFVFSFVVTVLGSNQHLKDWQLETPLLALIVGMLIGNVTALPAWFQSALRTEFYVKTGIVLMGATLPFTIILQAGPLAILQATIVAVVTFTSIYLAATRLFGLDPRFASCLGAGGSICGVSAAIAIGGACRAEKEHVSVAISLVIVWAVAMIFILPVWARHLGMAAGPTGAWIGTSEFADAAGYAAAAAVGDERAIKTFTLMKIVGRDMFVGIWALLVAFLSVTVWERKGAPQGERVGAGEIWRRFPKFIVGFFVASILVTVVVTHLGAPGAGAFTKEAIGPIKTLRGWAFTWAFLSIGFTTRFRELARFGWKPLAAFAVGVILNVPLGYWLSNHLFAGYWLALG